MAKLRLDRYLLLLDSLEGEQRRDVLWLLDILRVPPDLVCLVDGLRRVEALLASCAGQWPLVLAASGASEADASRLTHAIGTATAGATSLFGECQRVMGPMARQSEAERHPLFRYCITVCPIWSLLFTEPAADAPASDIVTHSELQAQVAAYTIALHVRTRPMPDLAGYADWVRTGQPPAPDMGSTASRIRDASHQVRRLSARDAAAELRAYAGATGDLRHRAAAADQHWWATEGQGTRQHSAEGSRTLGLGSANAFRLLHEELYEPTSRLASSRDGAHYNVLHRNLPDGYVRLSGGQLTSGAEPLADGSTLEHLFVRDSGDEDAAVDPADRFGISILTVAPASDQRPFARLEAMRQAEQINRRMSAATYDGVEIRPWHLHRLWTGLSRAKAEQTLSPRAYVLALTVLATGRDPLATPICFHPGPAPVDDSALLCHAGEWTLPVPAPAFATAPRSADARPTVRALRLPDYLEVGRLAAEAGLAELRGERARHDARKELDAWFCVRFEDDGLRCRDVERWLYGRLLDAGRRDVACATFITGRPLAHSRSSLHYTAVSIQRALGVYRGAMDPLLKLARGPRPTLESSREIGYIGATRVPTLDAVVRLVQAAAKRVVATSGSERRNALTAYTLLGLHLGAAARPVARRQVHELQYDAGFALLREKGTRYDDRPVPLAPVLRDQLRNYYRALRDWGYSTRVQFQWWDADGRPQQPFDPDDFRRFTSALGFDLEPYSLRRFVRTELCERGADGEDVDALMGHWFNRLSPHDPYSCYPIGQLARLARTHVAELLREVGFEALP